MKLFAFSFLLPSVALAGAFQLPDQDPAALGRASAYVADPGNPSAIYYNPGAMAGLEGFQADVGAFLIMPRADYKDLSGAKTNADALNFVIPAISASYRITKLLSVGISEGTDYGLTIQWPSSSPGRSIILQQALQTFDFSAILGLDFSQWIEGLRIGGGIDVVPASVYLQKAILFGSDTGGVALSGSALGVGGRAGIQWQPKWVRGLSLGVAYHSAAALNFSGNANFSAPAVYRNQLPPDGTGKTSLTLPQNLDAGVAYKFFDALELEFDFDWTNWSTFKALAIQLPGGTSEVSAKNWRDTITLRVGAEYTFFKTLSVRAGYAYDQTPVPTSTLDFTLPDTDRNVVTVGVGYQFIRQLRADLGAEFVLPSSRTTSEASPYNPPFKGTYDVSAVAIALSVAVKLDAPRAGR